MYNKEGYIGTLRYIGILKYHQDHGRYGPILKNYRITYIYQLVIP